jgi:hypothetical protein
MTGEHLRRGSRPEALPKRKGTLSRAVLASIAGAGTYLMGVDPPPAGPGGADFAHRRVGMVFQRFDLFPHRSVVEDHERVPGLVPEH